MKKTKAVRRSFKGILELLNSAGVRKVEKADERKEDLWEPGCGKLLRWLLAQSDLKAFRFQGLGQELHKWIILSKHAPKMSAWQKGGKMVLGGGVWRPTKSRRC